jgi:uncharacterized phage-associated protein
LLGEVRTMPFPAAAVANLFLEFAERDHRPISPLKVQKLVYFAHAWHLANFKTPLLNEPIEAWQYGPVIKSLYHDLKEFGRDDIPAGARVTRSHIDDQWKVYVTTPTIDDDRAKQLIESVWNVYRVYTAVQLANLTHEPGSPWWQIQKMFPERMPHGMEISDASIGEYFARFAAAAGQGAR